MSVKEVPSDHDFFDLAYVKHWTESISRYRPERKRLFEVFATEAARIKKGLLSVFELGCGPGFLAEALLRNCDIARYTLVDFSPEMLELIANRPLEQMAGYECVREPRNVRKKLRRSSRSTRVSCGGMLILYARPYNVKGEQARFASGPKICLKPDVRYCAYGSLHRAYAYDP